MPHRVLLVLAGADHEAAALRAWAPSADVLIGADGGTDRLLEAGLRCDILVGDLDSVTPAGQKHAAEIVHIEEQETTDFDKALQLCADRFSSSEVACFGIEGDQADHVMNNWSSLIAARADVAAVLRRGLGLPIRPASEQSFRLEPGRRVSLLPKTPTTGVTLEGVEWPLQDAEMEPGGRASISNRARGLLRVRIETGAAILFLETDPAVWPSDLRVYS